MELNIKSEKVNPTLHRKEIVFTINTKEPVKRDSIREKLIAMTNSSKERVIVDKFSRNYGKHTIEGTAKIYETKKDMENIELKFMKKRNNLLEEKPATAAPKPE